MKFNNPYLSDVAKANMLERWIVVHSILYYCQDTNVVSDRMYDMNSKQLVELFESMSLKEKRKTKYWYVFQTFDGSSGFGLYEGLNFEDREYLSAQANLVLRIANKN